MFVSLRNLYIFFTLGAAPLQFLFSDQTIQFGTFTSPFRVQYDDRIFDVLDLVETINPLGTDDCYRLFGLTKSFSRDKCIL